MTIENRLTETVTMYHGGLFIEKLAPGEHITYPVLEFEGVSAYEARSDDVRVLATRCFTWAELREQRWRIVFDVARAPAGTPGACEQ